jgi:hypothetical protein
MPTEQRGGRPGVPEQRVTAWPKIVTVLLFLTVAAVVVYMLLVHPSGGADNVQSAIR